MAEKYAPKEHVAQDITELDKILTADRWLLDVGLVSTSVQHNLILHGYLSSTLVDYVEVELDVARKLVTYRIELQSSHYRKYVRFRTAWHKYAVPRTLWQKWRRLQLLRESPYSNIEDNLRKMVSEYLPAYAVEITIGILPGESLFQSLRRFVKRCLMKKKKLSS